MTNKVRLQKKAHSKLSKIMVVTKIISESLNNIYFYIDVRFGKSYEKQV